MNTRGILPILPILPIQLQHVSFAVGGQRLLHDISVQLRAGQCSVIMGPNGAGKSLLLRLCHGLLQPSAGTIRFANHPPERVRWQQALLFQRPLLLQRSVAANIDYVLAIRNIPRRHRKLQVAQALADVGLAAMARRPARVLSGGEQQRLALARVLVLRPQVLWLDEPTTNLDPTATRIIENRIAAAHAAGCKVIMTTHDAAQARRHADEILFLHGGRLLEQTPAPQFFTQPHSDAARTYLAGELIEPAAPFESS